MDNSAIINLFTADVDTCTRNTVISKLTKLELINLFFYGTESSKRIELSELIHLSTRYVTNRTIVSCPQ